MKKTVVKILIGSALTIVLLSQCSGVPGSSGGKPLQTIKGATQTVERANEVVSKTTQVFEYIVEGDNRKPPAKPTRHKADVTLTPDLDGAVGYKFEFINIGDFSVNVGFNLLGGFINVGYSLTPHSEVSVGTQGMGIGVRI